MKSIFGTLDGRCLFLGFSLLAACGCSQGSSDSSSAVPTSAVATATGVQTITLSSNLISIRPGGTAQFSAAGGNGAYTFSVVGGSGTIGLTSGVFLASQNSEVDQITVTDSAGNYGYGSITVSPTGSITIPGATAPPAGSGASISGTLISCSGTTCTFQMNWQLNNTHNYVVTVSDPGASGAQKVFACGSTTGSASAPWVVPGSPLTFYLYDSSNCASSVTSSAPVASTAVTAPSVSYAGTDSSGQGYVTAFGANLTSISMDCAPLSTTQGDYVYVSSSQINASFTMPAQAQTCNVTLIQSGVSIVEQVRIP